MQDGINTSVGEQGLRLSGGQRQRIAIARALYSMKEIIILDEATSALDNKTEKQIINNISLLDQNITMIMIAHRLNTLKHCDRIIRIEKGSLQELDSKSFLGL